MPLPNVQSVGTAIHLGRRRTNRAGKSIGSIAVRAGGSPLAAPDQQNDPDDQHNEQNEVDREYEPGDRHHHHDEGDYGNERKQDPPAGAVDVVQTAH